MAKPKTEKNQKPDKKVKRERKVRREKKLRSKKEKTSNAEPQNELVIDGLGYKTEFTKKYLNRKKYQPADPNKITAFIPGTIVKVFVKTGKKVSKGDDLLILEAMKMDNRISAPHDAIVKKIYVKAGEMVSRNQLLIELKE